MECHGDLGSDLDFYCFILYVGVFGIPGHTMVIVEITYWESYVYIF